MRAKHISNITAFNGLISSSQELSVVGFRDTLELVAEARKEALENYCKKFEYIVFAVYFGEHEAGNFKAFNKG